MQSAETLSEHRISCSVHKIWCIKRQGLHRERRQPSCSSTHTHTHIPIITLDDNLWTYMMKYINSLFDIDPFIMILNIHLKKVKTEEVMWVLCYSTSLKRHSKLMLSCEQIRPRTRSFSVWHYCLLTPNLTQVFDFEFYFHVDSFAPIDTLFLPSKVNSTHSLACRGLDWRSGRVCGVCYLCEQPLQRCLSHWFHLASETPDGTRSQSFAG